MDNDIVKWFDDYHRKQKEEIAKAKLTWWKEEPKQHELFIYNK